jgi:hypothetical protein
LSLAATAALASSSSRVRLIAALTSSRYNARSTMIGRPRSLCRVGGYAALAWRVAAKQGDRADWVGITAVV